MIDQKIKNYVSNPCTSSFDIFYLQQTPCDDDPSLYCDEHDEIAHF